MITIGEGSEHFSGSLTRLLVWTKVLNTAQRAAVRDASNTNVDPEFLVLDWDGYVMAGSVQRLLGSRVCLGFNCGTSSGKSMWMHIFVACASPEFDRLVVYKYYFIFVLFSRYFK